MLQNGIIYIYREREREREREVIFDPKERGNERFKLVSYTSWNAVSN